MKKRLYSLLYVLIRLYWRILRPITLGVRLVLVQDGKVLLVRHTYQSGWFLPGGGIKRNETLEDAARREAREEVGAELGMLRLLGIYTNFLEYKSDHVVVFACEDFTLTGKTDGEIEAWQFFPLGSLPDDLAAGHRRRIGEYLAGMDASQSGIW